VSDLTLTFSGVGGAFAGSDQYQNNAFVQDRESVLLIDCGGDARHALNEQGVPLDWIEGAYISHLHADHIGGLEWLAFCTYFNPKKNRPLLYADYSLMNDLWEKSLRGGLDSIEGKLMTLTDYFDCKPVLPNGHFVWHDMQFTPVQTVHVMAGMRIVHSFGLMINVHPNMDPLKRMALSRDGRIMRVFYTADTQFAPAQLVRFYADADLIFHDCETSEFRSNVHAHFGDLCQLPGDIKRKMWLMHYGWVEGADLVEVAKKHDFAGFVRKGQTFELGMEG